MSTRIQVILTRDEREAFRRRADAEAVSLSAWLREAGRRRLAEERVRPLETAEEVRVFFATLPDVDRGIEPDWEAHLAAIDASRREGVGPS
ncbi:antitoxin VapB23 [soil metagenome]